MNLLIDEYKRMEKMVGKMGKSGLFGKGGDLTQLQRNPGQVANLEWNLYLSCKVMQKMPGSK